MEWSQSVSQSRQASTADRVHWMLPFDKTKPFFFCHWDCEGVASCLEAVHWMFLNLSQRAGQCPLFFWPARENIVWITCKRLNTAICFTSYLHPLPLHRNKANIIPWLLKMCMAYIAEKSTRLHQCCSHSSCQKDGRAAESLSLQKVTNS